MSKLYRNFSIILFLISLFVAVFLYIQYQNSINYWGNDSFNESLWLNPENKNIEAFRISNSAEVKVLAIEKESDSRYILKVLMEDKSIDMVINSKNTAIYRVNADGIPEPTNFDDFSIMNREKVRIDYYRLLDDLNIYVETVFYQGAN